MASPDRPARPRRLGFFSLALGALGLAFFCVPLLGAGLGGAGLVLGGIALLRGGRRGFASAGVALSAAALLLNLLLPAAWPERFPNVRGWWGTQPPPVATEDRR